MEVIYRYWKTHRFPHLLVQSLQSLFTIPLVRDHLMFKPTTRGGLSREVPLYVYRVTVLTPSLICLSRPLGVQLRHQPMGIEHSPFLARGSCLQFPPPHPCKHVSVNSFGPRDAIWRHRSGSALAQVMACCLTAPSHYLTQCWLIISEALWLSFEINFTRDTSATNP